MCYFQREKKNRKLTSGSIWQLSHSFSENIFKKFILDNSKQGECELEDLTHLLAQSLLKAEMFVNLFKIASNPVS